MAEAFVATQMIDRPIADVWEALIDWERSHEWMAVDAVDATGPTEVGTVLNVAARGRRHQSRITAVLPGRSITLESSRGGALATYTYLCERSGDHRTRVDLVADCAIRGPMAIFGPLFRRMLKKSDSDQLRKLRTMVESPR